MRLNVHQSVYDGKVGEGDTIRFHGRLEGFAKTSARKIDLLGQIKWLACGQQRVAY